MAVSTIPTTSVESTTYVNTNHTIAVSLYKYGRCVFIAQDDGNSATVTAGQNLGTLPQEYWPIRACDFIDGYGKHRFQISVRGEIVAKEAFSNSFIRFSACYISAS